MVVTPNLQGRESSKLQIFVTGAPRNLEILGVNGDDEIMQ